MRIGFLGRNTFMNRWLYSILQWPSADAKTDERTREWKGKQRTEEHCKHSKTLTINGFDSLQWLPYHDNPNSSVCITWVRLALPLM